MSNLKSIGCMIFCGSQTFGNIRAGFDPQEILEISNDILDNNCYHTKFYKNYPPIILPSTWENEDYLRKLQKQDFDLFFANNPCSGLSSLNRNASSDNKVNDHFYRVLNAIEIVKPKVAFMENAPTLINKGFPILQKVFNQLNKDYNFTIVRDKAGNHDVAMVRTRTFVIMWRKDFFNDSIPLLNMNKKPQKEIDDVLKSINSEFNNELFPEEERSWTNVEDLYPLIQRGQNVLDFMMNNLDTYRDRLDKSQINYVENSIRKINAGGNIWNKTPFKCDKIAPSLSSVIELINPLTSKPFTIREMATLMNYPFDFEFHKGGKLPIQQCIAQGVPANFIEYIHSEIKEAILGNRAYLHKLPDQIVNYQNHITEQCQRFNKNELDNMTQFKIDKKRAIKLTK